MHNESSILDLAPQVARGCPIFTIFIFKSL
jgi:hypothetical protein